MRYNYPIGVDDFLKLRRAGLEYVDKTSLIMGILDDAGTEIFLFPRPRRFGKTLNLSMLQCFLEKRDDDLTDIFADTQVWKAGDPYRDHFQRYPVLFLSLKDTRYATFDACRRAMRRRIQALVDEHRAVLDQPQLSPLIKRHLTEVLNDTAEDVTFHAALLALSEALYRVHGERVVILIDEYDAPIHAAYRHGYQNQAIEFVRALLSAGLKSNPYLFKGVVTGILRVAKESIFSGLNNLSVCTLLQADFNTCYGFTEAEVIALLEKTGNQEHLEAIRSWYDGYLFGGETIYNPWSVLNFLRSTDKTVRPYWLNTSSNDLVRKLLEQHALTVHSRFEKLLHGEPIEEPVDDNVVLSGLERRPDALWSLLLFSGYLKAEQIPGPRFEEPRYRLSIPNREVRKLYTSTFRDWMNANLLEGGGRVDELTSAMFQGDVDRFEDRFEDQLSRFVRTLLSYHNLGGPAPEDVYQGFIVGLCAVLEPRWRVRSEREAGFGRADVLIEPAEPGGPGVVLELKVARPKRKTLSEALAEGLAQLRSRDYASELRALGAEPVQAYAVAFDGKAVAVAMLDDPQA